MEEIREKFYAGNETSKEAFEELFAMVSALEVIFETLCFSLWIVFSHIIYPIFWQAEREESREAARVKVETLYNKCHGLRVKNQNLKAKYLALLDM